MIQRIQSVYLLLVAILMGVTFFSPLVGLRTPENVFLDFFSLNIIQQDGIAIKMTYGVAAMTILSSLTAFINIFLYKRRKFQMKLGYLTSFFIVAFYVIAYLYLYFFTNKNGIEFSSVYYGSVLPIIALVFNMLAIYKIKKDDKLVRSLDRIR